MLTWRPTFPFSHSRPTLTVGLRATEHCCIRAVETTPVYHCWRRD